LHDKRVRIGSGDADGGEVGGLLLVERVGVFFGVDDGFK